MSLIKKIFSPAESTTPMVDKVDYNSLIERGVLIVDVRTDEEYKSQRIKNAINIPLSQITNHIQSIKESTRPVLLYCKSGMRSQKGTDIMRKHGIECYNGGDFNRVNDIMTRLQQGVGL